jgi:hypothetical protein
LIGQDRGRRQQKIDLISQNVISMTAITALIEKVRGLVTREGLCRHPADTGFGLKGNRIGQTF